MRHIFLLFGHIMNVASLIVLCFSISPVQAASFSIVVPKSGPTMGILLDGEIVSGDDERFAFAIATAERQYQDHRLRAVALDSPGGQIVEAMRMVDRIRRLGLVTVVPDGATCASACAVLFASGSIKVFSPKARLGVHGAANVEGVQDFSASALTTYLAQAFGSLGAPASVIGRMVVTPPANMTWLSLQEVGMFPLSVVQSIDKAEFPYILSGYDSRLAAQGRAGMPLSLGPEVPSPPMPDYQRAGPASSLMAPPSRYFSTAPIHSKELVETAKQYSTGYRFGVSRANAVCKGAPAWISGCKGGSSARLKSYYNASTTELTAATHTRLWLEGYDESYRTKGTAGDCGNSSEPSNDGCRAGADAWPRLEIQR